MPYIPHTEDEVRRELENAGLGDREDLVAHKTFPLARWCMHLLVGLYGILAIYHMLLRL